MLVLAREDVLLLSPFSTVDNISYNISFAICLLLFNISTFGKVLFITFRWHINVLQRRRNKWFRCQNWKLNTRDDPLVETTTFLTVQKVFSFWSFSAFNSFYSRWFLAVFASLTLRVARYQPPWAHVSTTVLSLSTSNVKKSPRNPHILKAQLVSAAITRN